MNLLSGHAEILMQQSPKVEWKLLVLSWSKIEHSQVDHSGPLELLEAHRRYAAIELWPDPLRHWLFEWLGCKFGRCHGCLIANLVANRAWFLPDNDARGCGKTIGLLSHQVGNPWENPGLVGLEGLGLMEAWASPCCSCVVLFGALLLQAKIVSWNAGNVVRKGFQVPAKWIENCNGLFNEISVKALLMSTESSVFLSPVVAGVSWASYCSSFSSPNLQIIQFGIGPCCPCSIMRPLLTGWHESEVLWYVCWSAPKKSALRGQHVQSSTFNFLEVNIYPG